MNLYKSETYLDDLRCAIRHTIEIHKLYNTSILITGASGLLGSFIVDMLLMCNKECNSNITIYACGRSVQRLNERFLSVKDRNLVFVEHDVCNVPNFDFAVDYIIHAASNAYPSLFYANPVDTIMSNIIGTKMLLDYGYAHETKRFLYISSGEVYGQANPNIESFDESYSGYVDPTSSRSCYPNAKRTAETLCVSYTKQYGLDTVIVRPSHTYGPNATQTDNRANVQFVNKAIVGENIVLNSSGRQIRSYTYIADAASAILTVLICGESCKAYNIANPNSITTIAGFANEVSAQTGVKVIFSSPNELEKEEMSPILKQVLNSILLENLGYKGCYPVDVGISHTLRVLTDCLSEK